MKNSEIPDVSNIKNSMKSQGIRINRTRNRNPLRATSVAPVSHLSKENYGNISLLKSRRF